MRYRHVGRQPTLQQGVKVLDNRMQQSASAEEHDLAHATVWCKRMVDIGSCWHHGRWDEGFGDTRGGLCQPTPATCLAVGMRARSEHGGGMLSMVLHAGICGAWHAHSRAWNEVKHASGWHNRLAPS